MIKDQAPEATVALVSTCCDEATMDPLMFNTLRNRFKGTINKLFPIDSKSGSGINELKCFLLTEALKISNHQVVPLHIARGSDYISVFINLYPSKLSVTEKELLEIIKCNYLSKRVQREAIEILISFDIIRMLSNGEYLLQQQQLADVLARVVTKKAVSVQSLSNLLIKGVLSHEDDALKAVWGEYEPQLWKCSNTDSSTISPLLQLFYDSGLAFQAFDSLGNP